VTCLGSGNKLPKTDLGHFFHSGSENDGPGHLAAQALHRADWATVRLKSHMSKLGQLSWLKPSKHVLRRSR